MSLPQERFDEMLQRTALASLFYYPEVAIDDSDYSLEKDLAYCLEPVMALSGKDLESLRTLVGRVITNPSAHRADLVELVIKLAPDPVDE